MAQHNALSEPFLRPSLEPERGPTGPSSSVSPGHAWTEHPDVGRDRARSNWVKGMPLAVPLGIPGLSSVGTARCRKANGSSWKTVTFTGPRAMLIFLWR